MEELSIGEVARRAGIAASAMRFYEREGLIPRVARRNGRRIYDQRVVERLALIHVAKSAGFCGTHLEESDVASDDFAQICNLSSEELEKRRAMIKAEIFPHVRRADELPNGLACEFEASPAMRTRLEQLIELERRCCGGLQWSLEDLQGSDTLRLVVLGIDPRSELLDSFRGRP